MRILTISERPGAAVDGSAIVDGWDQAEECIGRQTPDVVVVDADLLAAGQEPLARLRARRADLAVVARCPEGQGYAQLLLGADATCSTEDEPERLQEALETAHRVRRDRVRWPRSFAERRVLVVAPPEGGQTIAADVESAGFTAQRVAQIAEAVAVFHEADVQVVLADHRGADISSLRRALRGFDPAVSLVVVTDDEPQAEAQLRDGGDAVVLASADPDVLAGALERGWLRWARRRSSAPSSILALGLDAERRASLAAFEEGAGSEGAEGWEVMEAPHLAEALDVIARTPPLCVVVDGATPVGSILAIRARCDASIAAWPLASGSCPPVDEILVDGVEARRSQIARLVKQGQERRTFATVAARLHEVDARRLRLLRQVADAQAELERLETIDHVTETLNRRGLELVLQRSLSAVRRAGGGVAACLVDCDDFLRVERRYGRGAGDRVLRAVAQRILGTLRQSDVIGRVGTDAFLIILPRTRLAEAGLVAERARLAVSAEPLEVEDGAVQISVSLGVAAVPWETTSIDEILVSAEAALSSSKGAGKDQVSGADGPVAAGMREVVDDLLQGGVLTTVAQPIVRLADDVVVAYEMLSRGREGLFEAPEQFLRIARDEGVLTAVDLQCLRSCLAEAKVVGGGLTVHLNLFPTTLLDSAIEELVRMLTEPEAPICLELSEEQFVGDPRKLLERVSALRSAGLRLAIDDVGKGRGTLDSVMILEPEVVKIDKDLVIGASRDVRRERLLRRLVALASSLGAEVIAEGVETSGDLDLVREIEVPFAQGFHWSEPGRYGDV